MSKTIRIGLGEVRSNYGTSNGKPALIFEPVEVAGPVGHKAPGSNDDPLHTDAVVLEFHAPEGADVMIDDIQSAFMKVGWKTGTLIPSTRAIKDEDIPCLCGHPRYLHERRATPQGFEDCRAKNCVCTHYIPSPDEGGSRG